MPRKLPPHVERNCVKGHTYLSLRIGKGPRIRLPADPTSEEFRQAYAEAMANYKTPAPEALDSINSVIASYIRGPFGKLSEISKANYLFRLEWIREQVGPRPIAGLDRGRIEKLLSRLDGRPGSQFDTLKKLRVIIKYAIDQGILLSDPSVGIKRPKLNEIRAWTDAELAAFKRRWPIGTKQRLAFELMLNAGVARIDARTITWTQIDAEEIAYTRHKSKVPVQMGIAADLQKALAAASRNHVTLINSEWGKPFSINGFSIFMREAITAAGLPLDCKPHGLRKTLGRLLADAGATAHDIMAALGHTTLTQAEKYTREADRKRGGRRAVLLLDDHMKNKDCPNQGIASAQTRNNRTNQVVRRGLSLHHEVIGLIH
jgi:integrase